MGDTNILITGKEGMLSSMLHYYFSRQQKYNVFTTSRNKEDKDVAQGTCLVFDAENDNIHALQECVIKNNISYIINAIGITKPHCKDDNMKGVRRAIEVNALFPHKLDEVTQKINKGEKKEVRVIQIATDCVFSGTKGGYSEEDTHDPLDVYGKSKSLGEPDGILNLRCSIIGPEVKAKLSVLEWFLQQKEGVKGFTHHKWNGITTLRYAKLIDSIIAEDLFDTLMETSSVHHFVPKYTVNKHELLELFNTVFAKGLDIASVDNIGPAVDRTLATKYNVLEKFSDIGLESDVQELKEIMDKDFYESEGVENE